MASQQRAQQQTGRRARHWPPHRQRIGGNHRDAKNFDSGRQVAAWLGLVPRQHSSGGKQNLLGISKRGDIYLRTLLIHGARSVIHWESRKPDSCSWVSGVLKRRNKNVAAVALANKNARIVWALLAHDREFRPDYVSTKAAM